MVKNEKFQELYYAKDHEKEVVKLGDINALVNRLNEIHNLETMVEEAYSLSRDDVKAYIIANGEQDRAPEYIKEYEKLFNTRHQVNKSISDSSGLYSDNNPHGFFNSKPSETSMLQPTITDPHVPM